jgi:hypothetical protein
MAIRLVSRTDSVAPDTTPLQELEIQAAISGTPASRLIENIERQTHIIDLCANGFNTEYRRTNDPLRRYSNILWVANEQLRQDLRSLIAVVRSE